MTLGEAQETFTELLGKLLVYGTSKGYKMRLGEGYDDDNTGHMSGSLHYIKLAQDIFIYRPGENEQDLNAHTDMHNYWDSIGGAKRIDKDLNHYSFGWKGKR